MEGFAGIYTPEERAARAKKENARLSKLLRDLGEEQKAAMERLVENAAFMAVTLDETRRIIARDGIIETYQNGQNQCGQKKSSAVEVYDKMMNTYVKVVRQLCDMLPQKTAADAAEEVLSFVARQTR